MRGWGRSDDVPSPRVSQGASAPSALSLETLPAEDPREGSPAIPAKAKPRPACSQPTRECQQRPAKVSWVEAERKHTIPVQTSRHAPHPQNTKNSRWLWIAPVVPTLSGSRDQLCGRQFFHGPGGQDTWGRPVLWPPDEKSRLIGKDPDAGKHWGQEENGATEDKMVGWHQQLNGHESEQALGDAKGQGSLACCSLWGRKELHTTEQLRNNGRGGGLEGESWFQDDLSTLHLLCTLFLLLLLHQRYLISSGIRSLKLGSPGFCHQLWGHPFLGSSSSHTCFPNLKGHFSNLPTTNFVNQEIFMLFYLCKILLSWKTWCFEKLRNYWTQL